MSRTSTTLRCSWSCPTGCRSTCGFTAGPIGTDLYIAGGTRRGIVWEISAVTDPDGLQRLRLLFQWVTRHIEFDELERRWNALRDQPEHGSDPKQLLGGAGRPELVAAPLPVSKDAGRDWYTTDEQEAVKQLDRGEFRGKRVWSRMSQVLSPSAWPSSGRCPAPSRRPPCLCRALSRFHAQ
jgi:hypothetical protein